MRENRPYGSVGGWGLIAPRLPNQSKQPYNRSSFQSTQPYVVVGSVAGSSGLAKMPAVGVLDYLNLEPRASLADRRAVPTS